MAQTGYTPILIYSSSTAAAAPAAGNLTNSTLGSELAINITDGKLFYKDNANAVQVIGWKVVPTTAGGTGLTSYAQGDLLYYNSGTTLTALTKSTTATRYLSNTGTNNNPAWAQVDLTNGVTGDLPYSNLAQGSALSVLGVAGNATADVASIAAGTDNQVLRRSGTSVGFGAIALNQSAAVTGTLPTGNGGTGLTSFTANGVVYASSTSALATGSALTFNGTDLATTGNVVISTNGKGIDFSATPGTGTSELLADYEEGTWTPVVQFGGASVGITYVGRDGWYTKIGNAVTISGWFHLSNKGSSTGDATISGLPFTAAARRVAVTYGRFENFSFSVQLSGRIDAGTSMDMLETTAAGVLTSITNSDFTNGSLTYFSATYFV
jgi:hypothetical protein